MEPVDNSNPPFQPLANEAPIQSPPLPNQPTPSKKKLPFIIPLVIIFFLLAVSSVAGYVIYKNTTKPDTTSNITPVSEPSASTITPTPDPTSDWKIYTSTVMGISFMYPSDGKVEESIENSYVNIGPVDAQKYRSSSITNPELYEKLYHLQFIVKENPNKLTALQFVNNIISNMEQTGDPTYAGTIARAKGSLKKYLIAGINGVSVDLSQTEPFDSLYLVNDDKIYVIKIRGDEGKPSIRAQKTIELILSTFKFTD